MNCHNCGGRLEEVITDLPFKIRSGSITIIKKLPVLQCKNCNEYLIEDSVMEKVGWRIPLVRIFLRKPDPI